MGIMAWAACQWFAPPKPVTAGAASVSARSAAVPRRRPVTCTGLEQPKGGSRDRGGSVLLEAASPDPSLRRNSVRGLIDFAWLCGQCGAVVVCRAQALTGGISSGKEPSDAIGLQLHGPDHVPNPSCNHERRAPPASSCQPSHIPKFLCASSWSPSMPTIMASPGRRLAADMMKADHNLGSIIKTTSQYSLIMHRFRRRNNAHN